MTAVNTTATNDPGEQLANTGTSLWAVIAAAAAMVAMALGGIVVLHRQRAI
jgi:LPXTG-motif cell wall-anchored protein